MFAAVIIDLQDLQEWFPQIVLIKSELHVRCIAYLFRQLHREPGAMPPHCCAALHAFQMCFGVL